MILIIDNYDSFTYNLVQYLGELGAEVLVRYNDAVTLDEIEALRPRKILLSPGHGTPDGAGVTLGAIERFAGRVPLFGVCLGQQAIGQAFGGRVVRAPRPLHGKTSVITHDGRGVFAGLETSLAVGRYHSLMVERATLPACLELTAQTSDGIVMGIRHRELAVEGVQFHPESILTGAAGKQMLANFLRA